MVDEMWMTTEAPVHRSCAEWSLKVCPHLRHLGRQPSRLPDGFSIAASIVGGPQFSEDFGLQVGQRQVLGSLKLSWPMRLIAPLIALDAARTTA